MKANTRAAWIAALALSLAVHAAHPQESQQAPTQVRPVAEPIVELATAAPDTQADGSPGARLDRAHDRLYLKLQRFLLGLDTRFSEASDAPLLVPASPLRMGLDAEWLRGRDGTLSALRPDFEATLRLPNIEQRLRVFVSSSDLPESAGNTALNKNPVRAGLRFAPRLHLDVDLGVRLKLKPTAYAALRWARDYSAGNLHFYPFAKPYVESGLGLGASGGFAIEHWRGGWFQRSASYANWVRNSASTEWSQSLLLGHADAVIAEGRYDRVSSGHDLACGTALHALATGARLSGADTYEIGLIHKRPLRGGWLYGYVEPLVHWERSTGWHPDAGVRIGFDALFWGLAATPGKLAGQCRPASLIP